MVRRFILPDKLLESQKRTEAVTVVLSEQLLDSLKQLGPRFASKPSVEELAVFLIKRGLDVVPRLVGRGDLS